MILHVGTNDIGYRAPYGDIISDFGNLIGICKKVKPSIQIIVSAILPRPVDHSDTDPMIIITHSYGPIDRIRQIIFHN